MNKNPMLGLWKFLVRIPGHLWKRAAGLNARRNHGRLAFMSADHHRVRDFVVLELPRCGAPISPEDISARLNIPPERTAAILNDLEKGMTFLFRNPQGQVTWAYPVTVDPTPHRVHFSTGEAVYAA